MTRRHNCRASGIGLRASSARSRASGFRLRPQLRSALVVAIVLHIIAGQAAAQDLDARAQVIAAKLRCPVCQNESVADSPAELAAQMRALIREKLAAGETEEQIVAYFVSKYGDWILLEPPRRGVLWLVWLAPAVAVLCGGYIVYSYLRRSVSGLRGWRGRTANRDGEQ